MAYDEQLANRIRQAFAARYDITKRKMFGGLAFLCLGRMCCGIVGNCVRPLGVSRSLDRAAIEVARRLDQSSDSSARNGV